MFERNVCMTPKRRSLFTYEEYTNLLRALKDRDYSFSFFSEGSESRSRPMGPSVYLRHDVDRNPSSARTMAEIEQDLDVQSTFFLLVRTDFYNVFSKANSEIVYDILEMNHRLGLHFDCAAYSGSLNESLLIEHVQKEIGLLESFFGIEIRGVSFHRPDDWILETKVDLPEPLVSTYDQEYTEDITYLSDSRGVWSHGHPLESSAFEDRDPLQILVHPPWWNESDVDPETTFQQLIDRKERELRRRLDENYTIFDPEKDS